MKRIVTVVAVLGLMAGACGGGDDDEPAAGEDATTTTVDAADEQSADAPDDDMADDDTSGDMADDDMADDDMADDDMADDDDGSSGGVTIQSINDVPKECRDQMANFLRDIEPIVSSIDWQSATLADFENIATEFETFSEEYDVASAAAGCDDLDFDSDGAEFELLIEFAQDEAPGVVPFFEFLQSMMNASADALGTDDGSASGDGSASDDAIETCGDLIAFVQNLMATYDTFTDAPASELMKFASIATSAYTTCSPDQLAFLESDEFAAFFGE